MKYLIADENDEFREWIGDIIRKSRDDCLCIADGTKLEKTCHDYRPDIILLDLELHNVNIFKRAEELVKEYPSAVIGIVSGYNDRKLREETEKAGAVFILKENLYDYYSRLKEKLMTHNEG